MLFPLPAGVAAFPDSDLSPAGHFCGTLPAECRYFQKTLVQIAITTIFAMEVWVDENRKRI
jgi:hypothetical protein